MGVKYLNWPPGWLTLALISGYKFCSSSSSFLSTTQGSLSDAFPFPLLFDSHSATRASSLDVLSFIHSNALLKNSCALE